MQTVLNEICERHGINPKFRPEFFALVEHCKQPGAEMRTRLAHVDNYREALREAQAVPTHYESLEIG